jgi:hypothetical protein
MALLCCILVLSFVISIAGRSAIGRRNPARHSRTFLALRCEALHDVVGQGAEAVVLLEVLPLFSWFP